MMTMPARVTSGPSSTIVAVLLVLITAVAIFRSPYNASNLEVVPDSVEAAVGAQRFVTLGTFGLSIDGQRFPSRYAPWFPTIILAPFYYFFPNQLGIGIIPVFALSLMTVLLVFILANRFGGSWAGVIACLTLLRFSVFRAYAGEITSDIPTLAPLLLAAWIFVRLRASPDRWLWLLAGLTIAAAGAIRPTSLAAALPFLLELRRTKSVRSLLTSAVLLLIPIVIVLLATASYQSHTFGDWRRNGYQFWCPVPYDFLDLTFSSRYLSANFNALEEVWLPITVGLAGMLVLLVKRDRSIQPLFIFSLLTSIPILVFHLLYFYSDPRFFLPIAVLLCVIGGVGLARLLPPVLKNSRFILPGLLLPFFAMYFDRPWREAPLRRQMCDRIQQTPDNAIIITNLDLVFLEPTVIRGSHRRVFPVSRDVEYASKLIARDRIIGTLPPGVVALDHRWEGLKSLGGEEVVPHTADEIADELAEQSSHGTPIFFALAFDSPPPASLGVIYSAFARRHLSPPQMIR